MKKKNKKLLSKPHTYRFFFVTLTPPKSTEKLIKARLGASRTIYVDVDSPSLDFPHSHRKLPDLEFWFFLGGPLDTSLLHCGFSLDQLERRQCCLIIGLQYVPLNIFGWKLWYWYCGSQPVLHQPHTNPYFQSNIAGVIIISKFSLLYQDIAFDPIMILACACFEW